MDSRPEWKRVGRGGSNSDRQHVKIHDGKRNYPRQDSYASADNYGNRMEDNHYNYERGNDSGYIDLNSAVDHVPGKKKRARIVRDAATGGNPQPRPYQKVVLKKKGQHKTPPPLKKKTKPEVPNYPEVVFDKPIRLNRYIASTGLCSRREADDYISKGQVKVNGEVVTEMGVRINPGDEISYNDKILTSQRKVYLLLNKPKGFVTSMEDPNSKKLVFDLVRSACKERIYPVGRLDKMTTGVLLFTNDGDLSLKLTHPSNRMRKVYQVMLDKPLTEEDMNKLIKGIELEDGFVAFDSVAYTEQDDHAQVGVEIHSGKNRIVRRMFEACNYKVVKLDRVYFAGLTRKGLKRGKWRFLSPEEVAFLKMMPA